LALATALEASSHPAGDSIVVANCNDTGQGSLRDAIATAPDGADIDLSALTCSTITLTSGAIAINQRSLYLIGPAPSGLTIDGNSADRIFDQSALGYMTIDHLSLAHGASTGDGGCIRSGGVELYDSTVHDCYAHAAGEIHGGAIHAYTVQMISSRISDSVARSDSAYAIGGGLYVHHLFADYSVIADNSALSQSSRSFGGGAYVELELELSLSTVSGNRATQSGGILLHGLDAQQSTIVESTISGNVGSYYMGGITTDSYLRIRNSTIAFNCASATLVRGLYVAGIGIDFRFSPPDMESTIVANNGLCVAGGESGAPQDVPYDIGGQLFNGSITGANNLVMTAAVALPAGTLRSDPRLLPLGDNGGWTWTHALSPLSPAVDAGNNLESLNFDQRGIGFPRTVGSTPDIGAFELDTADEVFASGFEPP